MADRQGDGVPDHDPHADGRRRKAPELHEDSPETYYVHARREGRDPVDAERCAKGLLRRHPGARSVVVLEPKVLYRSPREDVPDGEHVVELGKARIAREGPMSR